MATLAPQGPAAPAGSTCLAVTDVHHQYTSEPVLRGIDLAVAPGERVALMGPSGCGKSTLLLVAAGILVPTAGSVSVCGELISGLGSDERAAVRRRRVGFVFQFGELVAELSLRDNVALAAELAGAPRREALRDADGILDRVGLLALGRRKPGEVSGGQAQRSAVARALVHRPSLVLADEPTGALDRENAAAVLDLMVELVAERDAALLVATHDDATADRCDRVVGIIDGAVDR
ncbi:putative ABC transport system ATP-binding protein [Mumia flava]|uniref:Putative ABC transport system ATP-binding protein n=1 Tax=Mumia flava TaxID=1348852 RepID=A0A2M9BJ99_9ACTN|nr:putative ABC transport system ATP-binding protein [Mumia flava]